MYVCWIPASDSTFTELGEPRQQQHGQEEAAIQAGPAVEATASAGPGRAQAHAGQRLRPGSWSGRLHWKLKESTWPKLAKMAKQYLVAPFSSAGVERVFSAAGKMHDDLRKSEKDSTLEHSLFAAFNADYSLTNHLTKQSQCRHNQSPSAAV